MAVDQLRDGCWIVHYRKGINPEDPNRTREYFGRGDQGRIAVEIRNSELGFSRRKHKQKVRGPCLATSSWRGSATGSTKTGEMGTPIKVRVK